MLVQPPPRKFLHNSPSYVRWRTGKSTPSVNQHDATAPPDEAADTPDEALERADRQLREALEAESPDQVEFMRMIFDLEFGSKPH